MKKRLLLSLLLSGLVFAGNAPAQSVEEKGLAIAREAERRDTGFGDLSAELTMVLHNRAGDESRRRLRINTLEQADEGDKSLIVFNEPADVKGAAFLSHTHITGADDQWLYLPALKRVKRIASSNKSGPFMGSEFAYEDLASQEVEKYRYRYVREETLDGVPCFVQERVPVDENSGYTTQMVWLDTAEYRPIKIEFYDRKEALLKTLTFHDYRRYRERFWRADRMEMVNHQTGKTTTLQWRDYRFGNGYTERDFDQSSLMRAR